MGLNEAIKALFDEAVKVRRDLHKIPEIGFEEVKTSQYICNYLDNLGLTYKKVANTGIVAYLDQSSDKTIAFRADIDALSMEERTGLEFASTHEGRMHSCGHDGHMTMLLLFAKYLVENKSALKQNIVLIFQPAEEGPGGAKLIIEEGIFQEYKIDEIYGIHVHPEFNEGVIAISPGPVMAMTGEFDIDVYAKSGHGAMPHTTIDGILIASQLVNQLQSIVSRNINPTDSAVVTVGKMEGGKRRNIIAEQVRLEGTVRAFTEEAYSIMKERMHQIVKGVELTYDCRIEIDYRTLYPPVVNHSDQVASYIKANEGLEIVAFPPQMIAEDFSYYLKEVPGAFVFLGTRNEELGLVHPLHNSKFNMREEALLYGIQSYINVLNLYGSEF